MGFLCFFGASVGVIPDSTIQSQSAVSRKARKDPHAIAARSRKLRSRSLGLYASFYAFILRICADLGVFG